MASKTSRSFKLLSTNGSVDRRINAHSQRGYRTNLWAPPSNNSGVTCHDYKCATPLRLRRVLALQLAIGGRSDLSLTPTAGAVRFESAFCKSVNPNALYFVSRPDGQTGGFEGNYYPAAQVQALVEAAEELLETADDEIWLHSTSDPCTCKTCSKNKVRTALAQLKGGTK